MSTPTDHQDWLRRGGYPVPPGGALTDAERQLLTKFGHWMDALIAGALAPVTPDQEHFLRVHRGEEPPSTPFEVAWAKLQQMRSGELKPAVSPLELSHLFAELEAVRGVALAAQQRYTFRRLDVMAKVQPELDAIDAEMGPELKALADRMAAVEAAVKEAVLQFGRSFHHGGVHATHYRGRVTFDTKALNQYADEHPEINRFKKVGQPYVSLKYATTSEPLPEAGQPEALPSGEE